MWATKITSNIRIYMTCVNSKARLHRSFFLLQYAEVINVVSFLMGEWSQKIDNRYKVDTQYIVKIYD